MHALLGAYQHTRARKKACVLTLGCPESRIDSAKVQVFLQKNSYALTQEIKEADLILFRTCGLTKDSEGYSLEAIRKIKLTKKKDAKLIAWGCLSKINPSALRREYSGITFGEADEEILNEIVVANKPIEEIEANYLLPGFKYGKGFSKIIHFPMYFLMSLLGTERFSICYEEERYGSPFFIKVSTGCLGSCTFCVVKQSRGTVRSKSIDNVLAEFKRGLASGYKDFRLLATDLGAYGMDKGYRIVDLLNRMIAEEGDYVISLRNINPCWLKEMYEEMKPILSSGRIRFLSSGFESGSNRILRLMGRRYTIEEYRRCIQDLNRKHPNILLSTQVMVGFPTEKKQDFQQSEKILKELRFDEVELYKYSPRRGTRAAKMSDQVPKYIKEYRFLRLLLVSALNVRRAS
jgi:threonylcarbamoyladenosine tRNA methylthiotransferase CDKAL1